MSPTDAAFYFDLASPLAYLASEQVLGMLPLAAAWQPILANELPGAESFEAYRCQREREIFREGFERRAGAAGLQPVRWPSRFPFDSALAMRAATYAKSIGRVVPFAQAAFRQAFAGAQNLEDLDFVLIAAAACEMHPKAVIQSTERASVAERLSAATALAARLGIRDVPAVRIGERVFDGERALTQASSYAREIEGRQSS
jgi:2-hydroxychromene-2-carboxylate isomerase